MNQEATLKTNIVKLLDHYMASAYMASACTSHRPCLLVIIDRAMKTECMHLSSELLEETQSLFAKDDNVG